MGNNGFTLSELIPNAWFHKLRDMRRSSRRRQQIPQKKHHALPTPTTLTPTPRPAPPRSSSYYPRPPSTSPANSSVSTAGTGSFLRTDQVLLPQDSSSGSRLLRAATLTPPPNLALRPIITKPASRCTAARKTAVSSPAGMRVRLRRKSVRSRAVVKASVDPRRDFKESMEEMIAENKIRESKDMEELLACYLCLNSHEYHPLIISVFKQIWLHPPPPH